MSRTKKPFKLVVIDRDGTINTFREDFTKAPEEFVAVPGALEAVALLNRAGWHVVIATNQPGLGRGVLDMTALNAIHAEMHRQLAAAGGRIDAIFFCPHGPEESCDCRKPQPGLLLQIAERYELQPADIHMVGDAWRDMQAADQAGCRPHLVCTGECAAWRGRPLDASFPSGTRVHDDLLAFARYLLAQEEEQSLRKEAAQESAGA
jgi:D-glycero-D-manno-heptose 1,7-bisphosphate phosphatase